MSPAPEPTEPRPSALSAYALGFVLLLFPSVLKLIKVVHVTRESLRALDVLRVLASDVALACVSLALVLALVFALQRVRRGALGYAIGSSAVLFLLLELTALEHQTWARSSSLLDFRVLAYTLAHYRELRPVIAAETSVSGVLLLVGAALLAIAPALLPRVRALARRFPARARLRDAAIALLLGLGCAGFALAPPKAPELWPIAPSASLGLIAGAFGAAQRAVDGRTTRVPPARGAAKRRIERALAAAALSRDATDRPKNVLVVVLESTRFDATSAYVPKLGNTPRLVELAQHGALVRRAYVDMPHTSKALVSILCGYTPRLSVQINETEPDGLDRPCLPHMLGKLGYRRAFFQAAIGTFESRPQFALNAGFEQIFTRESYDESGFEGVNYLAVEDKVMVKPLLHWVDQNKDAPFFLTVLTCITHHSYGLPSTFAVREYPREPALPDSRLPRPWSDYNRYLNTVAYADEMLGEILDGLKSRGLLDDTLVVVVGDHGQGFDEHGQRAHNTVIWDEGVHVPLVFSNPRLFQEPRVVEGVRRQVDIAPTILDLIGVHYAPGVFEGDDLLTSPPHAYAYSTCWYDQRCEAETSDRFRVVYHFDKQPAELYDLIADPSERHNLVFDTSPKERARAQKVIARATDHMRNHARAVERGYRNVTQSAPEYVLSAEPHPAVPMHALLGDFVELLGYDTAQREVTPGGFWDAVVYFRCLHESPEGWRFFGVLESLDGREEQTDHHPANGHLFLHQCKPGTLVADPIHVWIPGDFPAGEARYWWGSVFLKQLGHAGGANPRVERAEVTPLERGLLVNEGGVLLTKLTVKPEYRPELAQLLKTSVTTEPPKIDSPLNVRFGRNLTLLSARIAEPKARRLSSLRVTTIWRVDGEQKGPWQIGLQIDAGEGKRPVRSTHTPVDGLLPIAAWKPGTYVVDTDGIGVLEKLPLGATKVWISVRTDDDQLAISDRGRATTEAERALVGTVEVVP